MKKKLPIEGQVLQTVTYMSTYDARSQRFATLDLDAAQVITSLTVEGEQKLILDIDIPSQLIPSSTPGHFHLYVDKEISYEKWELLLIALANAGIIEEGYKNASLERRYTAVRLPWIKKEEEKDARSRGEE